MERTTSRKQARARLQERQRDAAAAREARERANIGDLTEFTVQAAKVEEVDDWLTARVEALHAEADRRRGAHRLAAGRALQQMRLRGETVPAIAEAAGVSISRVREFLRITAEAAGPDEPGPAGSAGRVSPPPGPAVSGADGRGREGTSRTPATTVSRDGRLW